jgi:TPR repeat protein
MRNGFFLSALAFALAAACSAHAATPPQGKAQGEAPDVARDPTAAWDHFLATGDSLKALGAYTVLDQVAYADDKVDAKACGEHAAAMRDALQSAPVSVALHRAAMLCAEANGDSAGAEREAAVVAALARLTLSQASDAFGARPARVLRAHDIRATLVTAGLKGLYAYYPEWRVRRQLPLVVAAWDDERKMERHLAFDYVDATVAISRNPEARYPIFRTQFAAGMTDAMRDANVDEATDLVAWREGRMKDDLGERRDYARKGASIGGVMSARFWLHLCSLEEAPAHCDEGFVDTLLPFAENQWGWHMVLLSWAYAHGFGVPRDAAAATKLLDAADKRWSRMGGTVAYASLWRDNEDAPFPADLAARLARAEAAGNENATLLRLRQLLDDADAPLDAKDIAFLERPSQNGRGEGFAMLADWAEARKDEAAQKRWSKRAAEAGNPFHQAEEGWRLAYDAAGPHDEAAGLRWFTRAAEGGSAYAGLMLSYEAQESNDGAAAEHWLLDGVVNAQDQGSALELAQIYERKLPGVSGDPARAAEIYEALSVGDSAEARRRLAMMAMTGSNGPKNPARARALLEPDAKAGDHASESLLGLSLLEGMLGPVDEAEGERWVQRALAGGDKTTSASYGHWLFYKKRTDAARAKAIDVWRTGMRNKDSGAANNLAWAYCTAPVDALRDAKAGLEATRAMGEIKDLDMGHVDTVAACRAASGDFAGAVELQKKVLDDWRKSIAEYTEPTQEIVDQTKDFEERLALYEAKKPYIEPASKHE